MTPYIALLRKDAHSDYGVEFPDFPGCVTAGTSLEEARKMAAEALDLHLSGMQQDGEAIPEPSSLDTIMADPENAIAVVFPVEAARNPSSYRRMGCFAAHHFPAAISLPE